MISSLRIRNFALINELELDLDKGFSVITGETGSGKSILLGALDLLLGERADYNVIGPESDKSIVEMTADIQGYELQGLFADLDIDYFPQTIIRREISSSGRSRAFVNDTPVQLQTLRELTGRLVNIHSQYNTLELKNRSVQLGILDTLVGLDSDRMVYHDLYSRVIRSRSELKKLEEQLSEQLRKKDYNEFQLNELLALEIDRVDYVELEKEFEMLEHGESILSVTSRLSEFISGDQGFLTELIKFRSELDRIKDVSKDLGDMYDRLNSNVLEMKDLSSDVSRLCETIDLDPSKKETLIAQLDKYNSALRKHNVGSQEELKEILLGLQKQIHETDHLEEAIASLRVELEKFNCELKLLAEKMHSIRVEKASEIESKIVGLLSELKLPETSLQFKLERRSEPMSDGLSDLTLLFSANKGMEKVPVEKAASGGELSRVMLVIQKLVSEKRQMPTVLFDEIDTGVSGEVAQKIGNLLNKMGQQMQLIAITHLPQVAARSENHYKVEKTVIGERTVSSVRKLSTEEHVIEVARLMSGDTITEAAISNAKSLIAS
jgi:DNA repair protein RecN (Recombination protein N)